ncbi:CD63 antigen-like [Branchiostoma floridae]|uniref:Tetraspanin n=1 Tax=Branchiostoma floridae TaxID=7739 RepID=A0A9J7KJV6_BRAFL|nr:CD63 antigen-like [Branchiostoma floridae]
MAPPFLDTQTKAAIVCFKCGLACFLVVFLAAGITMLVVAAVANKYMGQFEELNHDLISGRNLCIVIGLFVTLTGILGIAGVVRENCCLLLSFAGILGCLFVLSVAAGVSLAVLTSIGTLREKLTDFLGEMILKVEKTAVRSKVMDEVQMQIKCCGDVSYRDWFDVPFDGTNVTHSGDVPGSCCVGAKENFDINKPDDSCGKRAKSQNSTIYTTGCTKRVADILNGHLLQIIGAGAVVIFLEAVGFTLSCCLLRHIRRRDSADEEDRVKLHLIKKREKKEAKLRKRGQESSDDLLSEDN